MSENPRKASITGVLVLAACLVVSAGLPGCMQPVRATSYDEAVAELGPPDKCADRPAGTYCSWVVKRSEAIGWRYELIMLFDGQGRLLNKKLQSEF